MPRPEREKPQITAQEFIARQRFTDDVRRRDARMREASRRVMRQPDLVQGVSQPIPSIEPIREELLTASEFITPAIKPINGEALQRDRIWQKESDAELDPEVLLRQLMMGQEFETPSVSAIRTGTSQEFRRYRDSRDFAEDYARASKRDALRLRENFYKLGFEEMIFARSSVHSLSGVARERGWTVLDRTKTGRFFTRVFRDVENVEVEDKPFGNRLFHEQNVVYTPEGLVASEIQGRPTVLFVLESGVRSDLRDFDRQLWQYQGLVMSFPQIFDFARLLMMLPDQSSETTQLSVISEDISLGLAPYNTARLGRQVDDIIKKPGTLPSGQASPALVELREQLRGESGRE